MLIKKIKYNNRYIFQKEYYQKKRFKTKYLTFE